MVLFVIGMFVTAYLIRETVRLWHEPDIVRWIGPVDLEPEVAAEIESELQLTGDVHAGHKEMTFAPKEVGKQRPKCVYRDGNFTFEKPTVTPVSCCAPLPSEQQNASLIAGPAMKSAHEVEIFKLVQMLPKDIRDKIVEEAEKIEKTRRQTTLTGLNEETPPSFPVSAESTTPLPAEGTQAPPMPPPEDESTTPEDESTTPPPPKPE